MIVELNESGFFKLKIKKTDVPVNIDFIRNEQVIKIDTQKYNLCTDESEYVFTYSINECSIEDAGQYRFEVSNTFGTVTCPARLLVKCKHNFLSIYFNNFN